MSAVSDPQLFHGGSSKQAMTTNLGRSHRSERLSHAINHHCVCCVGKNILRVSTPFLLRIHFIHSSPTTQPQQAPQNKNIARGPTLAAANTFTTVAYHTDHNRHFKTKSIVEREQDANAKTKTRYFARFLLWLPSENVSSQCNH